MAHDVCFKTPTYPAAGQNLYWYGATNHDSDINKVLTNAVNAWYSEIKYATQANIDKCCGDYTKIGHFTQVVRDSAIAIGCAASRYTSGTWKSTLIACNYSYGNMVNTPVYYTGSIGSACPNGKDSTYPNLCRT